MHGASYQRIGAIPQGLLQQLQGLAGDDFNVRSLINAPATQLPNAAQLNQAFMQSSHWFEPEQEEGRPPTQEEYEQAMAAQEMIEESRRHALYQSYASYGSEHPPAEYGADKCIDSDHTTVGDGSAVTEWTAPAESPAAPAEAAVAAA